MFSNLISEAANDRHRQSGGPGGGISAGNRVRQNSVDKGAADLSCDKWAKIQSRCNQGNCPRNNRMPNSTFRSTLA